MSRQVSPFAALSGAEKQIRWLEYQSIKLPYVNTSIEEVPGKTTTQTETCAHKQAAPVRVEMERPQPPPEVPRTLPANYQKTRHSQYDAVIARLKQAELQSRYSVSHSAQQSK